MIQERKKKARHSMHCKIYSCIIFKRIKKYAEFYGYVPEANGRLCVSINETVHLD